MIKYLNCNDGKHIDKLIEGEPLYLANGYSVLTKNVVISPETKDSYNDVERSTKCNLENPYIYHDLVKQISERFMFNPKMMMDIITYHITGDKNKVIKENEYSFDKILEQQTSCKSIIDFCRKLISIKSTYKDYVVVNKNTFVVITYNETINRNGYVHWSDTTIPKYNFIIPENNKIDNCVLPYFDKYLVSYEENSSLFNDDISLKEMYKKMYYNSYINFNEEEEVDFDTYIEEEDEDGEALLKRLTEKEEKKKEIKKKTAEKLSQDDVYMGVFFDLNIIVYTTNDEREREFLDKLFSITPPSMLECLWLAEKYDIEGKRMYKHYKVNTTSKVRDIYAPEDDVKNALKHLLKPITKAYNNKCTKAQQFAFLRNRSIKDNAKFHKNNKYILKADISGFYDSCKWELCWKYIKFLFPKDLENEDYYYYKNLLRKLLINPKTGGLYTGSPVSGMIANSIIRPAANYMINIFQYENIDVSIYADDITLSSNNPISKNFALGIIRYVFDYYELPFCLKPEKTKFGKNNGRRITGLRINHLDQVTIDRKKYNKLKVYLYRLSKNRSIDITLDQLQGYLSFAKYVDESGKINRLIKKYERIIIDNRIVIEEDLESFKNKDSVEFFNDKFEEETLLQDNK